MEMVVQLIIKYFHSQVVIQFCIHNQRCHKRPEIIDGAIAAKNLRDRLKFPFLWMAYSCPSLLLLLKQADRATLANNQAQQAIKSKEEI